MLRFALLRILLLLSAAAAFAVVLADEGPIWP